MAQYRQGDVFLFPVKGLPRAAKRRESRVLAEGETTGHRHEVIDGDVYVGEDGQLFVRATAETELRHVDELERRADHDPVKIDPGEYRVVIQRQYEPEGWRYVAD